MTLTIRRGLRLAIFVAASLVLFACAQRGLDVVPAALLAPLANGQHFTLFGYLIVCFCVAALVSVLMLVWGLSSKALGLPFRED